MKCNTILKPVTRMVFQCTWRNCGHECDVRSVMEEHVRIKHLGITSCTDDHEEDFYYTELELDSPLDSPLDSSGVSSGGDFSQSPMLDPTNNSPATNGSKSINSKSSLNDTVLKQARKRGPKPKFQNKHLIIESSNHNCNFNDNHRINSAVATWINLEHMDMARPAHEDPEYLSKLNNSTHNINSETSVITNVKGERKRVASNNQYASDQSDFESSYCSQQQNTQYLQNMTAEQLIKLQQENTIHLKNNIQHLQQLQRQHQHLNQLHQIHQYQQQVKRKYTKSQSSNSSILIPATRTKSVICNMAKIENDHHLLSSNLSSNPIKRSKPIKIPGISIAHREAAYQPPSFTVGSVQLSPTYFHCFSPTPPHSLSSPTSSNSSMYSLGSCNSPGNCSSSSITSNSSYSLHSGQSLNINRSSNYSSIDTLLQTVENERMQQQLAKEEELPQNSVNYSKNSNSKLDKNYLKLNSANASDLAQIEDDAFKEKQKINLKCITKENELLNNQATVETIAKCTNKSQLNRENNLNKKLNPNSVIRNGQEALLAAKNLTVDCDINVDNLNHINDFQTKQQQLVQTAQQALVTLASTASTLCNSTKNSTSSIQKSSHIINIEKSNSIPKNGTNSQINNKNDQDNDHQQSKIINQQNNGLLITANQVQSNTAIVEKQNKQSLSQQISTISTPTDNNQQKFNYLVSHSGRTIKPTAAAKSYVQRKHRIVKHNIRNHNSTSSITSKNGANKSKNKGSNLLQFERLLEAAQSNNSQKDNSNTSTDLNLVRNTIISNSNNNRTNNETQQVISPPVVQRTPTGRIRNSGAKCRKKYGMENKGLWCVQCRWKKACSRVDSNSSLNLTQYNNLSSSIERTEVYNSDRLPGRPENNTSNNNQSDQRRAVVTRANSSTPSVTVEQNQRNNSIDDYSAEEMVRAVTLINQRTAVSAK